MKNLKEEQKKPFSGSLPYTQEELDEYIEELIRWVHQRPEVLMRIVAKWVTEKFVARQSEQLKAFVDWWHGLSQEELAWYEGRYVEAFLSLQLRTNNIFK